MKTKTRKILMLLLAVVGFGFIGCDDEKSEKSEYSDIYNILTGSWVEITSSDEDGIIDTITFNRNRQVYDKTGIYTNSHFSILNDSIIRFSAMNRFDYRESEHVFKLSQSKDGYEIIFMNFITLSEITKPINVTYKKN